MKHLSHKNKKITLLSDTHGAHRDLNIPPTDIIVHCGDACNGGNLEELTDFFSWFSEFPADYKIFVPGNHDLIFDLEPELARGLVPKNVILLENNGCLIEGIRFHSVAARPWLHNMPELPKQPIDFLLTHGPALSILDNGSGCKLLYDYVKMLQPTYHIFGHVHETAGKEMNKNGVCFMNVG